MRYEPDIRVYETLDSTNNEAKRIIAGAPGDDIPFGTVIIAGQQTEGRGRRGKHFASPDTGSIYASFILRPQADINQPQLITIMAAVCVCKTIGDVAEPVQKPVIKWINDVFLNGRKVCGILTEAVSDVHSREQSAIVLGIGININVPDDMFPEEIRDSAGSVTLKPGLRERFLSDLIENVFTWSDLLEQGVSPIDEYRMRSPMPGLKIAVIKNGVETPATAKAITDTGSLHVTFDDGSEEELRSEEVSIREWFGATAQI